MVAWAVWLCRVLWVDISVAVLVVWLLREMAGVSAVGSLVGAVGAEVAPAALCCGLLGLWWLVALSVRLRGLRGLVVP